MELASKIINGVLIVEPPVSRLDASVAPEFKEKLTALLEGGYNRLILNLGRVDFIDSTGMTALVSLLKLMGTKNGEILMCNVGEGIKNLFRLTKLDRVFVIFKTEDEALASR